MQSEVRHLCLVTLVLGLILSTVESAHTQDSQGGGIGGVPGYPAQIGAYDPREVALLPRYCIYTQVFRAHVKGGNNPDQIEYWYALMGESFHAMHHYCWGLMNTNRAILLTRTQKDRMFYLEQSIGEFDYVLDHTPKNHFLLPEILTKKGENLIRLGTGASGILELQRAITLKPDYWPPYAYLGDYYKETGNHSLARKWLEKGLSAAPGVNALKKRIKALDESKD